MTRRLVLGIDLGSSSCKSVLLDERGQVVAASSHDYPTQSPRPGWAEQVPEDWITAAVATVRSVLQAARARPEEVCGVGIVGVTHNFVLLDHALDPLMPSIQMFDTRSRDHATEIARRFGELIPETTANYASPAWSWPQLAWVRDNCPDVWQATARLLFEKDYLRLRMTGTLATDRIDAAGSLLYSPVTDTWIPEFLHDLALDPSVLPDVVEPPDVVGTISGEAAAVTGLAPGTPVIAGTTDTLAELLGAGAVRPGDSIIKLASVGRLAVVAASPVVDPAIMNYRHLFAGHWYPGTASKHAASAYHWLRRAAFADGTGGGGFALMDRLANAVGAGSDGLLFHPHLSGEWAPHWDDEMRGSFVGLTTQHGPGHLARAVLEGVALSLRDALESMEAAGLPAGRLRLIGRGSRSRLWAQIVADVLQRPLTVGDRPHAAAGAALLAKVGIGDLPCEPESFASPDHERLVLPDPQVASRYDVMFEIYRAIDAALRPISRRLSDIDGTKLREVAV